jgi:hypothetical protein
MMRPGGGEGGGEGGAEGTGCVILDVRGMVFTAPNYTPLPPRLPGKEVGKLIQDSLKATHSQKYTSDATKAHVHGISEH